MSNLIEFPARYFSFHRLKGRGYGSFQLHVDNQQSAMFG
jgi:hypothetical protein